MIKRGSIWFFNSYFDMPENRKNPERTDVRDEKSGETERHQWNKEPRLKEGAISSKRDDFLAGSSGKTSDWRSWSEQSDLPPGFEK
jgi:hypothetical protein